MGWPKQLVLVRHAESQANVISVDERANFPISTHTCALTERGREQARLTGEQVRRDFGDFDVYYTSYYERAKETMRIMYPNAKVYEEPRLAEAQRGIWHVMTRAEITQHYPLEIKRRDIEGLYHHRPLGGENWPDVELRIHSFLGTMARDMADKRVLIVAHGFWLILFQRLVHHFSIDEALDRYKCRVFENASVTVYDSTDNGQRLHLVSENVVPWQGLV